MTLTNAPDEIGGFLQVSEGTRPTYDSRQPAGERLISLEVNREGAMQAIDPDKTYTVATNNFTAAGGDGHTALGAAHDDGRHTIVGHTDWEMLRDHVVSRGEVFYQPEGRIVDIAQDE